MKKLPLELIGTGLAIGLLITPYDWRLKLPIATILMYPSINKELKQFFKTAEKRHSLDELSKLIEEKELELNVLNRQLSGTEEAAKQKATLILNRANEKVAKQQKELESKQKRQQTEIDSKDKKLKQAQAKLTQELEALQQLKDQTHQELKELREAAKVKAAQEAGKALIKEHEKLSQREIRIQQNHTKNEADKLKMKEEYATKNAELDLKHQQEKLELEKARLEFDQYQDETNAELEKAFELRLQEGYLEGKAKYAEELDKAASAKAKPYHDEMKRLERELERISRLLNSANETIAKLERPEYPTGMSYWEGVARETVFYCYDRGYVIDVIGGGLDTNDSKAVFVHIKIRHEDKTPWKKVQQCLKMWAATRCIPEEDFPVLKVSGQGGYFFTVKNPHEFYGTIPGGEENHYAHAPREVQAMYAPTPQQTSERLKTLQEDLIEEEHKSKMYSFIEPLEDEHLTPPIVASDPVTEMEYLWIEYFYAWREKVARKHCIRDRDELIKRVWGIVPNSGSRRYLRERMKSILRELELIPKPL